MKLLKSALFSFFSEGVLKSLKAHTIPFILLDYFWGLTRINEYLLLEPNLEMAQYSDICI